MNQWRQQSLSANSHDQAELDRPDFGSARWHVQVHFDLFLVYHGYNRMRSYIGLSPVPPHEIICDNSGKSVAQPKIIGLFTASQRGRCLGPRSLPNRNVCDCGKAELWSAPIQR